MIRIHAWHGLLPVALVESRVPFSSFEWKYPVKHSSSFSQADHWISPSKHLEIFPVAEEMFDDILQATMDNATIAALKKEEERHKMIAEKIAKFLEELQSMENGNALPTAAQEPAIVETRHREIETEVHGRFSKMTQIEAVETILKEKGKAAVGSIFDELSTGGKPLLKPMYVSTLLSKNKTKFRSLGGGIWTLVQPEFLSHDSSTTQGSVTPQSSAEENKTAHIA